MSKKQKTSKLNPKLINAKMSKKFNKTFGYIIWGYIIVVLLAFLNMWLLARAGKREAAETKRFLAVSEKACKTLSFSFKAPFSEKNGSASIPSPKRCKTDDKFSISVFSPFKVSIAKAPISLTVCQSKKPKSPIRTETESTVSPIAATRYRI